MRDQDKKTQNFSPIEPYFSHINPTLPASALPQGQCSVAVGVIFGPGPLEGHPVVTVTVWVGITQPVVQPGQSVVTYFVGVCGQQSLLGQNR